MDAKELRQKSPVELERLIADLRAKLHQLRRGVATRALSDVRELRDARTDLARALAIQAEAKGQSTT